MNAYAFPRIGPGRGRRQRGLASLLVVMVLFFVVSLLAAYTNRNLIFEQKTSGNQYRAAQAFEASDAGTNWALAMLNGGRITDTCTPSTSTTDKSFQQRYLTVNATGMVTHPVRNGNWPTCVFDGTNWQTCACPDNTAVNPATVAAASDLPRPSFRVWLAPPGAASAPATPRDMTVTARPSVAFVQSVACTRTADTAGNCLGYDPQPEFGDGVARTEGMIMLRSGLAVPPAAAVTARGDVIPAPGAAKLRVENTVNTTSGITVHAGSGALSTAQMELLSVPGTPGENSVSRDTTVMGAMVAAASAPNTPLTVGERMFVSIFGVRPVIYSRQPGLRLCPSPCDSGAVTALLAAHPNRIIWANGDVTLGGAVGTAADPLLLVISNGKLILEDSAAITGMVYLTGNSAGTATIDLPATPTSITGAVVAEGTLVTSYPAGNTSAANTLTVSYSDTVVNLLRWTYGSWVRVGGSWRDFNIP